MGKCATCEHAEKVKGIFFTNYWCNYYNTSYYGNVSSCRNYVSTVEKCGDCVHFDKERGVCPNKMNKNKNSGACTNFES